MVMLLRVARVDYVQKVQRERAGGVDGISL